MAVALLAKSLDAVDPRWKAGNELREFAFHTAGKRWSTGPSICMFVWAGLISIASVAGDEVESKIRSGPPAWLRDSYWYHVDVPSFRDGDAKNNIDGQRGGDLAGLLQKLPEIKSLGVDTLWLSGVFGSGEPTGASKKGTGTAGVHERPSEEASGRGASPLFHGSVRSMEHVLESVSEASAGADGLGPRGSTSGEFSAGDKLFVDFVGKAHDGGFRVVVDVGALVNPPAGALNPDSEKLIWSSMRRWMDPNEDGDAGDGVDGWVVIPGRTTDVEGCRRWRERFQRIAADSVLICDLGQVTLGADCGGSDGVVSYDVTDLIWKYVVGGSNLIKLSFLRNTLQMAHMETETIRQPMFLLALRGKARSRIEAEPTPTGGESPEDAVKTRENRVRLAIALQHVLPGAPLVYFGDQSGLSNIAVAQSGTKAGSDDAGVRSSGMDGQKAYIALHRMLKSLRDDLAPLRSGDFQVVMADDERKLFAVSRAIPGNQVIAVLNFGGERQEVTMSAGRPGQLVGVLNPHLAPPDPSQKLRRRRVHRYPDGLEKLAVTGTRQFVNPRGEVSFRIEAGSIRLVLINDKEPR